MRRFPNRRQFLTTGLVGGVIGIGGCLRSDAENAAEETFSNSGTTSRYTSTTETRKDSPTDTETEREGVEETSVESRIFPLGLPSTTLVYEVMDHLPELDVWLSAGTLEDPGKKMHDLGIRTYSLRDFRGWQMVLEFANSEGAEAAYSSLYKSGRGDEILKISNKPEEVEIANKGNWLILRSDEREVPDSYGNEIIFGLQRTQNMIIGGGVPTSEYSSPQESLVTQIRKNNGFDRYGEGYGLYPEVIKLADHYRESVDYEEIPLDLENKNQLSTSFEDITKEKVRELVGQLEVVDEVKAAEVTPSDRPAFWEEFPIDTYKSYDVTAVVTDFPDLVDEDWIIVEDRHGEPVEPPYNRDMRIIVFESVDRLKSALPKVNAGTEGITDHLGYFTGMWYKTRNMFSFIQLIGMGGSRGERNGRRVVTGLPTEIFLSGNTLIRGF